MKPVLIVGLGNALMGDDAIGIVVAERLAADPRLPDTAEAVPGGTDLLRLASEIEDRTHVLVIDAFQDTAADPGSLVAIDPDSDTFDNRQPYAHHLSALAAIQLLRLTTRVPFTLFGIAISSASAGTELSPPLAARLPAILNHILNQIETLPAPSHVL